jgi:hypothetical protein
MRLLQRSVFLKNIKLNIINSVCDTLLSTYRPRPQQSVCYSSAATKCTSELQRQVSSTTSCSQTRSPGSYSRLSKSIRPSSFSSYRTIRWTAANDKELRSISSTFSSKRTCTRLSPIQLRAKPQF